MLPPRDVPPERLFRLLLRRPRPVLALDFRLPFAPDVALSVRGLTAYEDAEITDGEHDDPTRRSLIARRLIAALLLADGRLAFRDAEEVGGMTDHEITAVGNAVGAAAAIVSPMRRMIDNDAWHARLQEGARHPSNIVLTATLFASSDTLVAPGAFVRIAAPDRYFGAPYADITDGQLLAYYAAKAVMDKAT